MKDYISLSSFCVLVFVIYIDRDPYFSVVLLKAVPIAQYHKYGILYMGC